MTCFLRDEIPTTLYISNNYGLVKESKTPLEKHIPSIKITLLYIVNKLNTQNIFSYHNYLFHYTYNLKHHNIVLSASHRFHLLQPKEGNFIYVSVRFVSKWKKMWIVIWGIAGQIVENN